MTQIVLTKEQTRIIYQAKAPMEIRDPQGNWLGCLDPKEAAFLAEYKRREKYHGPFYSSEQVKSRLQAFQEEWDRVGGFDQEYMKNFLAQLNEQDPGNMRPEDRYAGS